MRQHILNFAMNALAAAMLLWLPLLVFFKHNGYPLFRAEVGLCLGLVAVAALFWGGLMTLGRTAGRVVVVTFLIVLMVDIQTGWITTWGLRLLLNTLSAAAFAWLFRRRLSKVVIVVLGAMILATILSPAGTLVTRQGDLESQEGLNLDLPFVLHIILDEHIGIDGIPEAFDPGLEVAAQLRDRYLDLGFRVFGRAYSRYYNTDESVGNILNFTSSPVYQRYFQPSFRKGALLEENAWFDQLRADGYRLHVMQTDFMTFLGPDPESGESSLTFPSETIGALAAVEIPAAEKARFILGSYYRLSFFLQMMRTGYASMRTTALGTALRLPDWDQSGDRLSILSSFQALDLLAGDLEHAGPGRAFFVHLLVPHYPYAYQSDCSARPMSGTWLNADDPTKLPRRNDAASRAERYPLYLEQLQCTGTRLGELLSQLAERDLWADATVVIHGDHGSRIDMGPPVVPTVQDLVPSDFLDAFSTLFVVKTAFMATGYDDRQLPLDHLAGRILGQGIDPGDPDLEAAPIVLIRNGKDPMLTSPMPVFGPGGTILSSESR